MARQYSAFDGIGERRRAPCEHGLEPAVVVRLQFDDVIAALFGMAVVPGEQVDQQGCRDCARVEPYGAWLIREIVEHYEIASIPPVAHGEYARLGGRKDMPIAPADLRTLTPHANLAFHPVEQRLRIPALRLDVHPMVAVDRVRNRRTDRFLRLREPAMRVR